MRLRLFSASLLLPAAVCAQQAADTLYEGHPLPGVVVRAYATDTSLLELPASLNVIGPGGLSRFAPVSVLQAVNASPGLRLEERSPGSLRLNIRGSSMRAPFGVRNVKVYYNDIPLTDPGGHTWLNQLGFQNIGSMEVIKGPGSSLYGAGSGGVMLISSMPGSWQTGASGGLLAGSHGLRRLHGELRLADSNIAHIIRYQRQESEGYRRQSRLRHDVLSWDGRIRLSARGSLSAHFLYSDLYYQTPGALSLQEFRSDPRQARPRTGLVPGATEAGASVQLRSFLAGFTYRRHISRYWRYDATFYGAYNLLHNPAIRNYAISSEPHLGSRALLHFKRPYFWGSLHWTSGLEWQHAFTGVQTYDNRFGSPDTLRTDERLELQQYAIFTQASLNVRRFNLTAGLSLNRHNLDLARYSSIPLSGGRYHYDLEPAPRLGLLYRLLPEASIYASLARGFSPPASTEIAPSGSFINTALRPEHGWNFEAGFRGRLQERLTYDVSAFYFLLRNAIVQRRDAAGGDYYLNAGQTRQRGLEAALQYALIHEPAGWMGPASLWLSYTAHRFRYQEFMQLSEDFSGNALPGVAPHTLAAGLDARLRAGLYAHLSWYYSDAMPLNDAGTAMSEPYHLLSARLGWQHIRKAWSLELFAGADNLLDQQYSLGFDINGFGGRYYNPAPGRSFYAGLNLGIRR